MKKTFDWSQYDPTLNLTDSVELYKAMRKEALRRFRSAHKGQLNLDIFRQTSRYLSKLNDRELGNLNRVRNRIAKLRAFLNSGVSKRKDFEEWMRKELEDYKTLGFIIPSLGEAYENADLGKALHSLKEYIHVQVRSNSHIPSKYKPIAETEVYTEVISNPDEYYQEEWQDIQVAPGVYRRVKKIKNTGKSIFEYIDEALDKWVAANRGLWEDEYGM